MGNARELMEMTTPGAGGKKDDQTSLRCYDGWGLGIGLSKGLHCYGWNHSTG
jgi:hypothetical protein